MSLISLTPREQERLQTFLRHARSGRECCRAQALLCLAAGEPVAEVTERLAISRQTLYNWVRRFEQRQELPLTERLADAPRSGRPATALGIIDPWLDQILDLDPRRFGYQATRWTAPLLQHYLDQTHDIRVCGKSISLALERLRVRWKRPRHDLGQRSPTWRQAKGG